MGYYLNFAPHIYYGLKRLTWISDAKFRYEIFSSPGPGSRKRKIK
jgi:hypothetical protein